MIEPLTMKVMRLAHQKGIRDEMVAAADEETEACRSPVSCRDDHDLDVMIVQSLDVHLEVSHAGVQLTAERALLSSSSHHDSS